MQKLILILTVLTAAVPLRSQETRTEITKATTPAEDSKANSRAVPDVYAISGTFDRVLVLRFKHQADLLAGLENMMKQEKVRNAVILSAIGSVRGYHYHTVSNRDFPSKDIFVKNPTAPADLVSMNGYVIDGRVHAHITLANPDKAFGGHLESGTEVFTFAVVTVGVLNAKEDLSRLDDKTHR
jgi:hypothetical protein